MTHQHCWVTTDPTGGDPWMGGPVTIVVCADCGREQMDRPNAYEQGQRDALAAAVQRVEAMTPAIYTPIGHPHEGCPDPSRHMTWEPAFTIPDIIAAIKGDQP